MNGWTVSEAKRAVVVPWIQGEAIGCLEASQLKHICWGSIWQHISTCRSGILESSLFSRSRVLCESIASQSQSPPAKISSGKLRLALLPNMKKKPGRRDLDYSAGSAASNAVATGLRPTLLVMRSKPNKLHVERATPLCLSFLLPVLSNFRWAIGPNHPNQPHCTTLSFLSLSKFKMINLCLPDLEKQCNSTKSFTCFRSSHAFVSHVFNWPLIMPTVDDWTIGFNLDILFSLRNRSPRHDEWHYHALAPGGCPS